MVSGMEHQRQRGKVIGVPIDALSWDETLARLTDWAASRKSRYVCLCNVHSVATAYRDPDFLTLLSSADMATPDGAPVAWTLRFKGFPDQQRISGPELMWRLCAEARAQDIAVGLFGASPETLEQVAAALIEGHPGLRVPYTFAPPYRALSADEDRSICEAINASGVGILFVGLGCPKQESWIAAHRGRIRAVMLGVGAAFDFHAGNVRRAPLWMRSAGLEWLYRLLSEPRRLWRRYLGTNSIFLFATACELLGWGWRYRARRKETSGCHGGPS